MQARQCHTCGGGFPTALAAEAASSAATRVVCADRDARDADFDFPWCAPICAAVLCSLPSLRVPRCHARRHPGPACDARARASPLPLPRSALGAALSFFEAQMTGRLPGGIKERVPWRGDTLLNDTAPNGAPLLRGW